MKKPIDRMTVRELARLHTAAAIAALARIIDPNRTMVADKDVIAAAKELIQFGWGMPVQQTVQTEVSNEQFESFLRDIETARREIEAERELSAGGATVGSA